MTDGKKRNEVIKKEVVNDNERTGLIYEDMDKEKMRWDAKENIMILEKEGVVYKCKIPPVEIWSLEKIKTTNTKPRDGEGVDILKIDCTAEEIIKENYSKNNLHLRWGTKEGVGRRRETDIQ